MLLIIVVAAVVVARDTGAGDDDDNVTTATVNPIQIKIKSKSDAVTDDIDTERLRQ